MRYYLMFAFLFLLGCATGERKLNKSSPEVGEASAPALEWAWSSPGAIIFTSIWLVCVIAIFYVLYRDVYRKN